MSETLTEVRDEPITQVAPDPFKMDSWTIPEQSTVIVETPKLTEVIPPVVETHIVETPVVQTPSEWYKEFGFDSEDVAKTEVKKWKDTPPTTQKEIEFANEQSRLAFEALKNGDEDTVFNILDHKRKLDKLTSGDINEKTASEIIKLDMQNKYKDLTTDEIEYKFNKTFGIPKEPVQKNIETDDEFLERQTEWKEKVEEIKRERLMEAKIIKPNLEKLKAELVLPNIQNEGVLSKEEMQKQKELQDAEIDKRRTQYLSSLSTDYKNFNGFETSYKDEEVDIPISYTVSEEEKTALKTELENFGVDDFILERWFNKDGTPNVKGLMKDIYLLRNEDKIYKKIANDTGAKVLDSYRKSLKNVSVTGGKVNEMTLSNDKSEQEKMGNFFAGL